MAVAARVMIAMGRKARGIIHQLPAKSSATRIRMSWKVRLGSLQHEAKGASRPEAAGCTPSELVIELKSVVLCLLGWAAEVVDEAGIDDPRAAAARDVVLQNGCVDHRALLE